MAADDLLDLDLTTGSGSWGLIRNAFLQVGITDGFLVLEDLADGLSCKVWVRVRLLMVHLRRVFILFLGVTCSSLPIRRCWEVLLGSPIAGDAPVKRTCPTEYLLGSVFAGCVRSLHIPEGLVAGARDDTLCVAIVLHL